MSTRVGAHLRSNVLGLVAIFIALTGTAVAGQVAATNSVVSKSIQNGQVKKPDLAANAVRGHVNVVDGSIGAADLGLDSVGADQIADDAVGADQIAANAVGASEIADDAVGSTEVADNSLGAGNLAPSSVENSELAANAVTGAKVSNRSLGLVDVAVANGGQSSLNLPSIAAQSCTDITRNVTGVLVTDVVLVTPPPTLPAGVIVGTRKAAANGQIVVRACNVASTASTDPEDAAMSFAVFR